MNRQEAVLLCRYVKACCPQQTLDEFTPDAWHDLLGDLSLTDCREAVKGVALRQPFVAPAEIRAEVYRIRKGRLENADKVIPAADPDNPLAYIAALKTNLRDLADGREPRRAIGPGPEVVDPAGHEAVWAMLAEFEARRDAAEEQRRLEREADREALTAYIDAHAVLITLPDYGASFIAEAKQALFGGAEAAAGFPRAADAVGITDRQKIVILAGQLARDGEPS